MVIEYRLKVNGHVQETLLLFVLRFNNTERQEYLQVTAYKFSKCSQGSVKH